jgi:hypothetical protein
MVSKVVIRFIDRLTYWDVWQQKFEQSQVKSGY